MLRFLAAAAFLIGCASGPRPPPLEGWRELRSAHFRLRTDLPEEPARSTLESLETLRWWLQAAWSTGGDSPGSTDALVLRDAAELETFTSITGLATTAREGPLLVIAGSAWTLGSSAPSTRVLAHEVGHELIHRRMPGAPRWFHEGLAGYLESVLVLDDHRVRFGFTDLHEPDQPVARPVEAPPVLSLDETTSRHWETAAAGDVWKLYRSARVWVSLL